ncbi:ATPase [alpha proteobacterium U9-1i]|nr:ATPase [alpha proteobacterium U9-1i]
MKLRGLLAAVAIAGCAALLASCETMSADECAAADWGALGFNDAAQNGRDRFSERAESCAEKGFMANADDYNLGLARGLYEFCQPGRAFDFARRGGSFNGSCPAELQGGFYAAFSDGQRVHGAEQELSEARSRVSSLESRRREIDDNIGSRERSLAEATTDTQRAEHRAEIERLRRERRDVNDDISVAQSNVPRLMRYVDQLRFEMGSRWGASW